MRLPMLPRPMNPSFTRSAVRVFIKTSVVLNLALRWLRPCQRDGPSDNRGRSEVRGDDQSYQSPCSLLSPSLLGRAVLLRAHTLPNHLSVIMDNESRVQRFGRQRMFVYVIGEEYYSCPFVDSPCKLLILSERNAFRLPQVTNLYVECKKGGPERAAKQK